MKKFTPLTFTLFFLLSGFSMLRAQITADSVPTGMFAVNPNINLSVTSCGNLSSAFLDLNCDNVYDMRLDLYKGYTAIDGANALYLYILNDTIEVCKDTAGAISGFFRPHYYNTGDPLINPVNSMWSTDTLYQLGDFGCMGCTGPATQTSKYIAFRKLSQTYWMKVSFGLIDNGSCPLAITASVTSILSPCLNDGIHSISDKTVFQISPNPFSAQTVLSTDQPLHNATLTVYNAFGQVVKQMDDLEGQSIVLDREGLPEGVYFIRLTEGNEIISTNKIMVIDK